MELGLTIPLQRHLNIRNIPYGEESDRGFCWDLHALLKFLEGVGCVFPKDAI